MTGEHKHPDLTEAVDDLTKIAEALTLALAITNDRLDALENATPNPDPGPGPFMPAYPGQPEPGTMYWGAAIKSQEPADLEAKYGDVGMHRLFFQWNQVAYASGLIDKAHARGWVPWISMKTPKWVEVASGQHDSMVDAWLNMLKAKDQAVWLTPWHEPENDLAQGRSLDHRAMNARFRARMTELNVTNVALAPILMGWTWDPGSGRNPDDWWPENIYDFMGVDPYEADMFGPNWQRALEWATDRNVQLAVGEWGFGFKKAYADQGERVHDWYESGIEHNVAALTVWSVNNPGLTYELTGEQLTAYLAKLADPRTVRGAK